MAAADFPASLKAGISPGQGLFFPFAPLGSTECRQWLLGFVFASTLAPDILPHCPFVFLRSNVCLPPFRAASLRRRPGGSATVGTTSPRREPFIPPDQTPAGHTSTGDPPVPVGDPPTGRARRLPAKDPPLLAPGALPIPPGDSPGETGRWPVLPEREFPDALSGAIQRDRCSRSAAPAPV